jgi:hypothetical protein
MKAMKVKVENKDQCKYDFFWEYDSKFISRCETLFAEMMQGQEAVDPESITAMSIDDIPC